MAVDADGDRRGLPTAAANASPRRSPPSSRTAAASRIGRPRESRSRPNGANGVPVRVGRPPGAVNRATRDVREAFTLLVQKNAPKLQRWLDRVARTDPGRAADLIVKLSDFVIPKLTRMEVRPVAPVLPEGEIDANDAAAVYARIVGEPGADLSGLRFSPRTFDQNPTDDSPT